MTIQARYAGACGDCGGPIKPGDEIGTRQLGETFIWGHSQCPDDDPLEPETVCPDCHLDHKGECF